MLCISNLRPSKSEHMYEEILEFIKSKTEDIPSKEGLIEIFPDESVWFIIRWFKF